MTTSEKAPDIFNHLILDGAYSERREEVMSRAEHAAHTQQRSKASQY